MALLLLLDLSNSVNSVTAVVFGRHATGVWTRPRAGIGYRTSVLSETVVEMSVSWNFREPKENYMTPDELASQSFQVRESQGHQWCEL